MWVLGAGRSPLCLLRAPPPPSPPSSLLGRAGVSSRSARVPQAWVWDFIRHPMGTTPWLRHSPALRATRQALAPQGWGLGAAETASGGGRVEIQRKVIKEVGGWGVHGPWYSLSPPF